MAGNPTLPDASRERLKQRLELNSRRSNRTKTLLYFLRFVIDVVMLVAASLLGYVTRFYAPLFGITEAPALLNFAPIIVLQTGTVVVVFYFSRLYHQRRAISRIDNARNILGAVTIGLVLANGIQELLFKNTAFDVDYLRGMFFSTWVLSVVLVIFGRELHSFITRWLRRRGTALDNLLLVGTGRIAREIAHRIQGKTSLGYRIVGAVTDQVKPKGKIGDIPIIGLYNDIPSLIDEYNVEQVIIAVPEPKRQELFDLVNLCQRGRVDIKIYPDVFAYMAGDMNVDDLDGTPLLTVRDIALRGWKLSLKRGMDFVGALFGLIFLSPILLLLALLIRLESPGPVFYTQIRMGLDGRPFPMIKFRSMRTDAESRGPGWTVPGDPRVTRLGSFLRRTELDELPNLINVFLGQMSLVGPRPERPYYVHQFRQQIPRYMERHREKAGMTGWAQVNGLRGDTSIAERTSYDLWYVENWSLWLDLKIIIRTIWMALTRSNKNAY